MTTSAAPGSVGDSFPDCRKGGLRDILQDRAGGLTRFGYRAADAEFLVLAGFAGGHFVRRQFRAYTRCGRGGRETAMLHRAAESGHIVSVVGKSLYRVRGAALGRAIGLDGALPVPGRAWRSVKKTLITLDYCIEAAPSGRWLLSERDKVRHFASLGIPADRFPLAARTRAGKPRPFPGAFPIRLSGAPNPTVAFCYAHSGASESGVLRHLRLHEPLAAALRRRGIGCDWAALADSPAQFLRMRSAWRRWRAGLLRDWAEREYFQLRRTVERRQWSQLSAGDLERLAGLRPENSGDGVEDRYRRWLEDGSPEREPGGDFAASCRYREVLLDRDYRIAERVEA